MGIMSERAMDAAMGRWEERSGYWKSGGFERQPGVVTNAPSPSCTLTVGGREYTVEPTGLKYVAYTLKSGHEYYDGIRLASQPGIVAVVTRAMNTVGWFSEATWREVVAL